MHSSDTDKTDISHNKHHSCTHYNTIRKTHNPHPIADMQTLALMKNYCHAVAELLPTIQPIQQAIAQL
jgi:hypothetical protein